MSGHGFSDVVSTRRLLVFLCIVENWDREVLFPLLTWPQLMLLVIPSISVAAVVEELLTPSKLKENAAEDTIV